MEEYLQIGVITTTHGVRGEVKVYPTTDPERFLSLDRVFLDTGKEKKELHVTGVRFFKQLAIVKFKGIDNINDIERYKGCSLYVTREDAIPLEEDEYYIADLQGMQMYTEDGGIFGLYAGNDIVNADGIVVVKKGSLIEKAVTGEDGTAIFTADLPIGNSYYVKEEQAPSG